MRIAVFGGSFNPPHVVHAMVAGWIEWTGRADEIWLVPVFQHAFGVPGEDGAPSRHDKSLAPFDNRVSWTRALAGDIGAFARVCTIESELPTPSYTIDTLRELSLRHPSHDFHLVVGADVLPQVSHWRDWDGIVQDFAPIIVGRQGHPHPPGVLAIDFPAVSSTEVRRRLRDGEPVDHLLTRSVADLLLSAGPDMPSGQEAND